MATDESTDRDREGEEATIAAGRVPDRTGPWSRKQRSEPSLHQDDQFLLTRPAAPLAAIVEAKMGEPDFPAPSDPIDHPISDRDISPTHPDGTKTAPALPLIGPPDSQHGSDPGEVYQAPSRRPDARLIPVGQDHEHHSPDSTEVQEGNPSSRPQRLLSRPRVEPIDVANWAGRSSDQIDPRELLLIVALNVMSRYETWCGLHRFEMPPHLKLPPNPKVGWGGARKDDLLLRWIWLRIARRCLRRRIDPIQLMDLVGGDNKHSRYPAPIDHYLDEIDVRAPELRERAFESTHMEWDRYRHYLKIELVCSTGRTDDYEADEIAMALHHYSLSSEPLFSYCYASNFSIHSITDRLAPLALLQYVYLKDSYDELFGGNIPAPLRLAGEALYDLVDREGD